MQILISDKFYLNQHICDVEVFIVVKSKEKLQIII